MIGSNRNPLPLSFILCICIIFASIIRPSSFNASAHAASLNGHTVVLDNFGKIIPWTQNPADGYDRVMFLSWDLLKNKIPIDRSNGLKVIYTHSEYNPDDLSGTSWPNNPAGKNAMLADAALLYYAYSGDREVINEVVGLLDHQLLSGSTPQSYVWGGVPWSTAAAGSVGYGNDAMWEGVGVLEPDKVGELGFHGYLRFYQLTGDSRYLEAAIRCSDALAKNIRPESALSATMSPWPFRVTAQTGAVYQQENYSSHVIASIRLFDELIRMNLGDTNAYRKAREIAWNWLVAYPMQNDVWSNYFEDVRPQSNDLSNVNQYNPGQTARYILENPGSDPNWQAHAAHLIKFIETNFGGVDYGESGIQYGAQVISEQVLYKYKMASHTARYASVNALYYLATGDESAKEKAYRSLNWSTYMCRDNGVVIEGPAEYASNPPSWFTDGHGDYIRHFMVALGAIPEWAPAGQNHITHSTSVIQSVSYAPANDAVTYTTYDSASTETMRLAFTPTRVLVNGQSLGQVASLSQQGWTYNTATGVFRVRHDSGTNVQILAGASDSPVPTESLGLVAAYGFDEETGSQVFDSSTGTYDGVVEGATWSTEGRYGSALSFNGNGDLVSVADAASLDLSSGMTIMAWINPSTAAGWRNVLMKQSNNGLSYALYASDDLGRRGSVYINTGVGDISAFGPTLPANTWTHLAATYDGSELILFVDGSKVTSAPVSGSLFNSSGPLQIGGNNMWGEYFSGLIDEVRIYNRALSSGEILRDRDTFVASLTGGEAGTSGLNVSLVSPQDGAVISGTIVLEANTSSDTEIAGVIFELDGSWLGEVVKAPFQLVWDSSSVAEGMHSLTAIARDAAGNETSTPVLLVEVQKTYNAAPEITSVFPPPGTEGVSLDQVITITFSEPMDVMTISKTTIGLLNAAGVQVAADVTYNSTTYTVTLKPADLMESNTAYQVVVDGGAGSVADIAGQPLATDHSWSFTTKIDSIPVFLSFWDDAAIPTILAAPDTNAVELGMKFRGDVDGIITALRFYKSVSNTGTHTGSLWTADGSLLASVTFRNETASGWQEMPLPTPVAIRTNTTYVVSYHTEVGRYSADMDYFTGSGYDKSPLRALASGEDGGNGVYLYGAGGFPNQTWNATNYWVDVVFQSNLVQDIPNAAPEITSVSPPPGTESVSLDQVINITFSEAMDAMTTNKTTIELLNAAGVQVAADVTYNSTTHAVTLKPANLLESNTAYQVVVYGGAGGVTDIAGQPLATDHSWSFTTKVDNIPVFLSFWDDAAFPAVLAASDTNAVELGMKFRSDVDGVITALRFYKSVSNTGTHTGNLWTASGTLLASVTFRNETASGWQEMPLPTPLAIRPNTTYVVSYHTGVGRYSADIDYFTGSGYDKSPLRALASGEDGANGVYLYGAGGFPSQTWNATNYWVDVVFEVQ